MQISNGYLFRAQSEDFVWASNEYPVASQGFFIYTHPFNGKASITTEALVKARNEFAKRIPGPSDGSYMTTVKRLPNVEDEGYVWVSHGVSLCGRLSMASLISATISSVLHL